MYFELPAHAIRGGDILCFDDGREVKVERTYPDGLGYPSITIVFSDGNMLSCYKDSRHWVMTE